MTTTFVAGQVTGECYLLIRSEDENLTEVEG